MSGMRAVIVGAGVGGLTLALLLRQRGITAEVVEQAPELREAGAAIALASNATKVLVHLGLGDDLAAASTQPTAVIHRDGRDGHPVSAHPMGGWYRRTFGAPFYGLHRAGLQQPGATRRWSRRGWAGARSRSGQRPGSRPTRSPGSTDRAGRRTQSA